MECYRKVRRKDLAGGRTTFECGDYINNVWGVYVMTLFLVSFPLFRSKALAVLGRMMIVYSTLNPQHGATRVLVGLLPATRVGGLLFLVGSSLVLSSSRLDD